MNAINEKLNCINKYIRELNEENIKIYDEDFPECFLLGISYNQITNRYEIKFKCE